MEAHVNIGNTLLVLSKLEDKSLIDNFCGIVLTPDEVPSRLSELAHQTVYLCGDLTKVDAHHLTLAARVLIIKELCHNYEQYRDNESWVFIKLGQVPIRVHGVGVLYRHFFDLDYDYFARIQAEHTLQSLTQSTKPNKALRKGIYLTSIKSLGSELHFRLLRCSANLGGPTDNFRATDFNIVNALNAEAAHVFRNQAPLNHVLAQSYHNTPATYAHKQTKAKIPAHADKTKDMPANGIMAFCTFYDKLDKLRRSKQDPFDYVHKSVSGLTKLRFRLKESISGKYGSTLPSQFSVTLYPNSVFFMPLSTNRFYTHEIQPSPLDAELLPTRLGYVVRCSSREATYDGNTYIKSGVKRVRLDSPTPEGMEELRRLYAAENSTDDFINYGDRFPFSMNEGDYLRPNYEMMDEFRTYTLPTSAGIFEELAASVHLEVLGRGREGAVLTRIDEAGRIPIVRTTTRYKAPAQHFQPIHKQLARRICRHASLPSDLNNALFEVYTNAYTTMGFHSDQALDLAEDSYIAVYSCYEHPELANPRTLVVESKAYGDQFKIPMLHNSVIIFSTETNRRFKHKIILEGSTNMAENRWLGMTFRTSKTLVEFCGEEARLLGGDRLASASEEERREFYRLRGLENREMSFVYPPLSYTVSEGDRMKPVSFW